MRALGIIAHRGSSFEAPENTLSAMKLAWAQNADAIELDLLLSKDGRVVVFHDADTRRFEAPARRVADLTWEELQTLDVGGWKSPQFAGERIPMLNSILATIPKGRRAVVELKAGPEIVPEFARIIRTTETPPEKIAVISFDLGSLIRSKEALPLSEHYLIASYKKDPTTGKFPDLATLIATAKNAALSGLDLQFTWPIDAALVETVHEADLKLLVWTVDDPDIAKLLSDAGVDGITTNRPGYLREQLMSATGTHRALPQT